MHFVFSYATTVGWNKYRKVEVATLFLGTLDSKTVTVQIYKSMTGLQMIFPYFHFNLKKLEYWPSYSCSNYSL